ncbi:sialate O-acetylesterase [Niabella ginsengisoli]|uniref:Sialate O-acetylesterase n=1 Tax=Niabella ginsengisoli TaxID=522298 RepID=A0ABS9SLK1_9BACT|nr:sialate O-acetylesterase [Niabella ginsengisoli]MCH5599185.1 sialate O-acetylesterase [Niabella ginsengisoli]
MYRKLLNLALFTFISISSFAQADPPDSNFHLYLLIGQSNMAGRGPLDELGATSNSKIVMLDSLNQWVIAKDPVHFDKPKVVGVGPGLSFANAMLEKNSRIKIGLVPCAWGGSPIKVWQPGESYLSAHPYDDAIRRTKIAMQKGVLKGILWHQGESDNNPDKATKYLPQLVALVKRLRSDLDQPELPFIAGEIGYFSRKNHINAFIDQLPDVIPHTMVVSAKGLQHKGDSTHFDSPSARTLGVRYAKAMKQLQSGAVISQ